MFVETAPIETANHAPSNAAKPSNRLRQLTMVSKRRKKLDSQLAIELPIVEAISKAIAQLVQGKAIDATCPQCQTVLYVQELGETAWSTRCECGKCNDTLRGL